MEIKVRLKQNNSSNGTSNTNSQLMDSDKHVKIPRCLATLPNNIEELIANFKMQGLEASSQPRTFLSN
jgi:hypothetical protein